MNISFRLNGVFTLSLKPKLKLWFLPRDAMRSLLSADVRLSVRLSVTLVHCIQTAEDIVKLLSRRGSPIILVS